MAAVTYCAGSTSLAMCAAVQDSTVLDGLLPAWSALCWVHPNNPSVVVSVLCRAVLLHEMPLTGSSGHHHLYLCHKKVQAARAGNLPALPALRQCWQLLCLFTMQGCRMHQVASEQVQLKALPEH